MKVTKSLSAQTGDSLSALQRLLHEAASGGQSRVDALLALTHRQVFVTQKRKGGAYRSMVTQEGQHALLVFTSPEVFNKTCARYGWIGIETVEIPAREAFRYANAANLDGLVVDAGSDHAMSIGINEISPILDSKPGRELTGPFNISDNLPRKLNNAVSTETGKKKSSLHPRVNAKGSTSSTFLIAQKGKAFATDIVGSKKRKPRK